MSESTSAERTDRDTKPSPPASSSGTRLTWIPVVAALLTFLVGVSDVLAVFKPDWHERLHKFSEVVPGALTNAARTSDVIIGLLLLMLARGLRRRKRSAWQAVIALLAFNIVIHFLHFPHLLTISAFVGIVLLGVLVWRHGDFYAVGDPRSRRTVLQVFVVLVVMDFAIGLGYLAVGPLDGSYTFTERLQDVLYELFGVYGRVQWAVEGRADLYHGILDELARSARSPWSSPSTCSSARPSPGRASPPPTRCGSGTCSTGTATGTPSATSRCVTTRA